MAQSLRRRWVLELVRHRPTAATAGAETEIWCSCGEWRRVYEGGRKGVTAAFLAHRRHVLGRDDVSTGPQPPGVR